MLVSEFPEFCKQPNEDDLKKTHTITSLRINVNSEEPDAFELRRTVQRARL